MNKLISLLIAVVLIGGFCYMIFTAFERTHNLECEAYTNPKLFPYPTEIMKSECPEQFNMKGGE